MDESTPGYCVELHIPVDGYYFHHFGVIKSGVMMRNSSDVPLPFMGMRSTWVVEPTGDWSKDNLIGRGYSKAFIIRVQTVRRIEPLLGYVVRDMVTSGQFGGIEVGFFHGISEEIISRSGR